MIDETNRTAPPDDRAGFCQDCGRPLNSETVRKVGSGIFCDPCLQARVTSGTVPPPAAGMPPPPPGTAPAFGSSEPSPVLAGLLGLIPGVGAMYNGQFAKGIAHLVIFLLLEAMTNAYSAFGILIMGWVFYQVFDAYQTARARREGTPLPDPFGLNNIGTHLGDQVRQDAARRAAAAAAQAQHPPYAAPNSAGPWSVSPDAVVTPPGPYAEPVAAAPNWQGVPMQPPVSPYSAPYPQPPAGAPYATQPAAGWAPVADPAAFVAPPARRSNIPSAAAWLIGLGILFTVLNVMPEWRFSVHKIFPFLLIAFAVWLFLRRMWFSGGLSPAEGEGEGYVARVVGYLRGPVLFFSVGILWMLQEFDVARMHRTWPILLIVLGVTLMAERSLTGRALPATPVAAPLADEKGL